MWSKVVGLCQRCREESSIEGKEIKNVAVLTIAFQLVYTGFYALQNLHSSLHDEDNLGLVCLSVLYGTGIISSVLSPTIIGMFGAKPVLVTAFAAHSIYILANFYASFASMIPGAIFLGAFFGPAWTSQGVYISACSYSYTKTASSSPFSVLSRFNGFFFAVMASTQILGNVFTSLVIRDGIGNNSEVIVFKYCGPKDCPAFENATEIEDAEPWVIDLTLFVFLALAICGLLLIFLVLTPLPRSEWIKEIGPKKMTAAFVNILFTTNMPLLVPFIIFTGMEHAFLMGSYTKSYISCPIGIHMVGFVMSAYGITTPVFFLIFSKLVRITGRFILLMSSSLLFLVLLIFLLHWEPQEEDSPVVFLVPVLWGVAESVLQAQANALIALMFPEQKEAAFANFHAWRSLGYCVTFLNVAYLCVSDKIIICIVCLVVGSGLYVFVEIKAKVKENDEMKATPSNGSQGLIIEDDTTTTSTFTAQSDTTVATFQSIQERLSFSHHELREIIQDAETCWKRDSNGSIVLKVDEVMSEQHLRESKVTTLYHARPVSENLHTLLQKQQQLHSKNISPRLKHSQSESQFVTQSERHTYPRNSVPAVMISPKLRKASSYLVERSNLPPRKVSSFHAHLNSSFECDEEYSDGSDNYSLSLLQEKSKRKSINYISDNNDEIDSDIHKHINIGSGIQLSSSVNKKTAIIEEDGKENIELKDVRMDNSTNKPKEEKENRNNDLKDKDKIESSKAKRTNKSSDVSGLSVIEKMNKTLSKKEKEMKKKGLKIDATYNHEIMVKSNGNKTNKKKVNSNANKHGKNVTSSKSNTLERKKMNDLRVNVDNNNENDNAKTTDLSNGNKVGFYLHSPGVMTSSGVPAELSKLDGLSPEHSDYRQNGHQQSPDHYKRYSNTHAQFSLGPLNEDDADSDGFVDIDEEDIPDTDDGYDVDLRRISSEKEEDTISIY